MEIVSLCCVVFFFSCISLFLNRLLQFVIWLVCYTLFPHRLLICSVFFLRSPLLFIFVSLPPIFNLFAFLSRIFASTPTKESKRHFQRQWNDDQASEKWVLCVRHCLVWLFYFGDAMKMFQYFPSLNHNTIH